MPMPVYKSKEKSKTKNKTKNKTKMNAKHKTRGREEAIVGGVI